MERVEKEDEEVKVEVIYDQDPMNPLAQIARIVINDVWHFDIQRVEEMAVKLRAVLAGADVIEMPSEDEIETSAINAAEAYRKYIVRFMIPTFQRAYEDGYKRGVFEIKSEIVK